MPFIGATSTCTQSPEHAIMRRILTGLREEGRDSFFVGNLADRGRPRIARLAPVSTCHAAVPPSACSPRPSRDRCRALAAADRRRSRGTLPPISIRNQPLR